MHIYSEEDPEELLCSIRDLETHRKLSGSPRSPSQIEFSWAQATRFNLVNFLYKRSDSKFVSFAGHTISVTVPQKQPQMIYKQISRVGLLAAVCQPLAGGKWHL